MLTCPACGTSLRASKELGERAWACGSCAGCAVRVSVLREKASAKVVDALWAAAKAQAGQSARACPACRRPMNIVTLPLSSGEMLFLDVCRPCNLVWFDRNELAELSQRAPREKPTREVEQALGQAEIPLTGQLEAERQALKDESNDLVGFAEVLLHILGEVAINIWG